MLTVVNDMMHLFHHRLFDMEGLLKMLTLFSLNFFVVWVVIHFFYYPKSRRRDYYFTFSLLSSSIFMMIFLMDGSKMEIGAALGLFAVFGIIRYRTESIPIREMTYLFFLVAISVVNGTTEGMSLSEHLLANALFVLIAWLGENVLLAHKEGCKFVQYDNIELIRPDREKDLIADLSKRLGLEVLSVEVGAVDFLKDSALLRVYYHDKGCKRIKSIDQQFKIIKDDAFS